jgi:hypothetical protein
MMLFIRDARKLLESQNRGFSELTFYGGNWTRAEKNNEQIQE